MNKFLLLLLFTSLGLSAQAIYKTIPSQKIGGERQLKIQLPRNYQENTYKSYPVILVFDADHLFEPVAGNVDFYSYWDFMPQAIVVGVMQTDRETDTQYSEQNFLPIQEGATFFDFVGGELFPWLAKNYRTAGFNMAVGHDLTANFSNFYLLRDQPLFQAYISLSPDFSPQMQERLTNIFRKSPSKLFYYQATGTEDIPELRNAILPFNEQLQGIENPNFIYYFDDFTGADHYSLAGQAIPKALERIFSVYTPIDNKEYTEVILKLETSPYDYLVEKYDLLKNLYGLKEKIRTNDFFAIAMALQEREDWKEMEKLGKLARKEYPDTVLGNYYLGLAYEGNGEPKKAMRSFESALVLKAVGAIDKDLLIMKANAIKKDFGY